MGLTSCMQSNILFKRILSVDETEDRKKIDLLNLRAGKRRVCGSRTFRLPPPPSVGSALFGGCAGSAARETKQRRRRRKRAGPGPWPGRSPAPCLPSRHCCRRPRPRREVFEHELHARHWNSDKEPRPSQSRQKWPRCGSRGPERLKACLGSHSLDTTELTFEPREEQAETRTEQRAGKWAVAWEVSAEMPPPPGSLPGSPYSHSHGVSTIEALSTQQVLNLYLLPGWTVAKLPPAQLSPLLCSLI